MGAAMDAAFTTAAAAAARGQAGNGAVIVDPTSGQVVATGGDAGRLHPLKCATRAAASAARHCPHELEHACAANEPVAQEGRNHTAADGWQHPRRQTGYYPRLCECW